MQAASSRLPVELYRDIVQHIHEHADLLSLLSVSRVLSYEVERVLYRHITIEMDLNRRRNLPGHHTIPVEDFLHRERVAHHVLSASFSAVCSAVVDDHLIPILRLLKNIKSLTLQFRPISDCTPFHYFLPEKIPFRLVHLAIYGHECDRGLISFFRSQRDLTELSWSGTEAISDVPLSPSDLPHITTLASNHPSVINAILPGRNVRLLDCAFVPIGGRYFNLGLHLGSPRSFPSVRALILPEARDLLEVSQLFPSLQYLEVQSPQFKQEPDYDQNLLPYLNLFIHLSKFRLFQGISTTARPEATHTLASKLFACHDNLGTVEISSPGKFDILFRFERGFEEDKSLQSSGPLSALMNSSVGSQPWFQESLDKCSKM